MTGTWITSHITSKYAYVFSGDFAKITANSTLDITNDFRLGFQVKFNQLFLNGTLFSKSTGSVNDPTLTTYNIHSINGYLRVKISDGTKFLVYDTNDKIYATYKAVQTDIVWDNTAKLMKIYVDGVNKAITLNTSDVSYYTDPALFTTLNVTSSADLNFGKGEGQPSFKGTLFGGIFSSRTFTSSEIFDYFNGKQDTVSTPPTETILYKSKSLLANPYNIYEMYNNGTSQSLKISSTSVLDTAYYDSTKNKIVYTNVNDNHCYCKDFITLTNIRFSPTNRNSNICPTNPNRIVTSYENRMGDGINRLNFANPNVIDSFEVAISPPHNLTTGALQEYFSQYSPDGTQIACIVYSGVTGYEKIVLFNSDLETSSRFEVFSDSTIGMNLQTLSWTPDNNAIVFDYKVSGIYQIFKINTNGTGLTQLTAEPYDSMNPVVSPDGTQIAFSIKNGVSFGSYLGGQIHLMNIDGTNIINISNNNNNEYPTDWK